jgi:hypothetical protein
MIRNFLEKPQFLFQENMVVKKPQTRLKSGNFPPRAHYYLLHLTTKFCQLKMMFRSNPDLDYSQRQEQVNTEEGYGSECPNGSSKQL